MPEPALPPLRDVIKRYGLSARKQLGQHFLLDRNLSDRIARTAGDLTSCDVIEIGPGPGGLTRSLLDAGSRRVIAVEKDQRCIEALNELAHAYPGRLEIIAADATKLVFSELSASPRKLVSNLPYNVSTVILIEALRQSASLESMTLMFQREVADRLTASPGTKAYGRLSVLTQWLCATEPAFNVDARAFTPAPRVTSTVVTLTPYAEPGFPARFEAIETVTAAAFGQRRKMLRASLKSLGLDPEAHGIDPTRRGETLTVGEFCRLANALDG